MSSNRLIYDNCDYKNRLNQSVDSLQYILDVSKYENKDRCRHRLGLVGGAEVQETQRNLVELENELRGQFKVLSLCPEHKHSLENNGMDKKPIKVDQYFCRRSRNIKTNYPLMKNCQFIDFRNIAMDKCPNL